jgi:predicted ArsR family transcriptional regulator
VSVAISKEQWLKALNEAQGENDPEALTVEEIAALLGLSKPAARGRIDLLLKQQRLVKTRKIITRDNGRPFPVLAFKLVKEK